MCPQSSGKKNKLWIRKYRANFKGGLDGERKI